MTSRARLGARKVFVDKRRNLKMDKKTNAAPKIAEIAKKIVALLEPLNSEDRQRAITASLVMLGEASTAGAPVGGLRDRLLEPVPRIPHSLVCLLGGRLG